MELYLVHHARAVSAETDADRPLSEQGRGELQKIIDHIRNLDITVDYFWCSKKKRAVQTAELLSEAVRVRKRKLRRSGFSPTDDVKPIVEEIAGTDADIMIVGHLPFLANLTSLLLTGDEFIDVIVFKNAGIVALTRDEENTWRLKWILTPEVVTA